MSGHAGTPTPTGPAARSAGERERWLHLVASILQVVGAVVAVWTWGTRNRLWLSVVGVLVLVVSLVVLTLLVRTHERVRGLGRVTATALPLVLAVTALGIGYRMHPGPATAAPSPAPTITRTVTETTTQTVAAPGSATVPGSGPSDGASGPTDGGSAAVGTAAGPASSGDVLSTDTRSARQGVVTVTVRRIGNASCDENTSGRCGFVDLDIANAAKNGSTFSVWCPICDKDRVAVRDADGGLHEDLVGFGPSGCTGKNDQVDVTAGGTTAVTYCFRSEFRAGRRTMEVSLSNSEVSILVTGIRPG